MKTLIKTIGVMVFCLVMYAIPILIACSFLLDWNGGIQFLLTITGFAQLATLCVCLYVEVEDEG